MHKIRFKIFIASLAHHNSILIFKTQTAWSYFFFIALGSAFVQKNSCCEHVLYPIYRKVWLVYDTKNFTIKKKLSWRYTLVFLNYVSNVFFLLFPSFIQCQCYILHKFRLEHAWTFCVLGFFLIQLIGIELVRRLCQSIRV